MPPDLLTCDLSGALPGDPEIPLKGRSDRRHDPQVARRKHSSGKDNPDHEKLP